MATRFLRIKEVLHRTGMGKSTLYYLEKKGEFPKRFLITPRCAVWDEDQVDKWMEARILQPVQPATLPSVFTQHKFTHKAAR